MREGRWWWRDQGSQRKRSLHAWMRWDKHSDILSHAMCARNECDNTRLRRLTTTRTFICYPSVSRHCWVSCASCWCFSGSWFSRCHWCRTSHRSAGRFFSSTLFHHAYAIPSTKFFLLDVVVRLCPVIVRQLNLYPKFLHISHLENGSFEFTVQVHARHGLGRHAVVRRLSKHGLNLKNWRSTKHNFSPFSETYSGSRVWKNIFQEKSVINMPSCLPASSRTSQVGLLLLHAITAYGVPLTNRLTHAAGPFLHWTSLCMVMDGTDTQRIFRPVGREGERRAVR